MSVPDGTSRSSERVSLLIPAEAAQPARDVVTRYDPITGSDGVSTSERAISSCAERGHLASLITVRFFSMSRLSSFFRSRSLYEQVVAGVIVAALVYLAGVLVIRPGGNDESAQIRGGAESGSGASDSDVPPPTSATEAAIPTSSPAEDHLFAKAEISLRSGQGADVDSRKFTKKSADGPTGTNDLYFYQNSLFARAGLFISDSSAEPSKESCGTTMAEPASGNRGYALALGNQFCFQTSDDRPALLRVTGVKGYWDESQSTLEITVWK